MRLFLASYRYGDHVAQLCALVPPPARVAVIGNACDGWPQGRSAAVTSDLVDLRRLGFSADELDLRHYLGRPGELRTVLTDYAALWVRGGNTFVLRAQFARSGCDTILRDLLTTDALVYAGYSAGACVLAPDLRGLQELDDPAEVWPACGVEARWDGLGLLDRPIVPHIASPLDPSGQADRLAARYRAEGIPHWALRDTDALMIHGDTIREYRETPSATSGKLPNAARNT